MNYTVSIITGNELQYIRVFEAGTNNSVAFNYRKKVNGFPFILVAKTFLKIYLERFNEKK